ncbi:MAG: BA14K family protein [Devosia sp.]
MVVTPFLAAVIIGSFWTGVGLTALHDGNGLGLNAGGGSDLAATVDDDHDALCHARYQSYDSDTGLYLTYGGKWKECTLGL